MLDLSAANEKTGVPDDTLTAADVEVLDDDKPVPLAGFLRPHDAGIRPVVLWIVVQCAMPDEPKSNGSGFLRDFTAEIASGLTHLAPGEAYGVAHWCDDGASSIDLAPNRRIAQLGPTVGRIVTAPKNSSLNPFLGEDALLKVIHDSVEATAHFNPQAAPVLLFLYGDHSAANTRQVAALEQELLAASATVFLLNDGLARTPHPAFREIAMVIGHLSQDTGGAYFHAPFGSHDPFVYAQAIAAVLDRLHSRYQLLWTPRKLDGEEHPLFLKLTSTARKAHPGVELHFQTLYQVAPGPLHASAAPGK